MPSGLQHIGDDARATLTKLHLPVVEPVHLEIETDIGVESVIANGKLRISRLTIRHYRALRTLETTVFAASFSALLTSARSRDSAAVISSLSSRISRRSLPKKLM